MEHALVLNIPVETRNGLADVFWVSRKLRHSDTENSDPENPDPENSDPLKSKLFSIIFTEIVLWSLNVHR